MHSKSPSDTAILIARSILLSAQDPSLLALVAPGEEAAMRRMLGCKAAQGWFGFLLERAWGRRSLMLAERLLLGGIFAHYLARKRWIEKELRRGIAEGMRQVVVVGAGYDSLAWRLLEEFPHVRFFEIDHPATQAAKHVALGESPNLHFIPANLATESPPDVLAACPAFDPGAAAIVIAEGFTMYFDKGRVEDLLASFAVVAGRKGLVLFTFMTAAEDGSFCFRGENPAVGWWLRLRREPFRWGSRKEDLPSMLKGCGLSQQLIVDHRDLRRGILVPLQAARVSLARGECLCLCTPDSP